MASVVYEQFVFLRSKDAADQLKVLVDMVLPGSKTKVVELKTGKLIVSITSNSDEMRAKVELIIYSMFMFGG